MRLVRTNRLVGEPKREVIDQRGHTSSQRIELLRVRQEGRSELLWLLEAQGLEFGSNDRVLPLPPEVVGAHPRLEASGTHQHPVQAGTGPERAVGEGVAVGADDGPRIVEGEVVDRQQVGADAARRQAVAHELEDSRV